MVQSPARPSPPLSAGSGALGGSEAPPGRPPGPSSPPCRHFLSCLNISSDGDFPMSRCRCIVTFYFLLTQLGDQMWLTVWQCDSVTSQPVHLLHPGHFHIFSIPRKSKYFLFPFRQVHTDCSQSGRLFSVLCDGKMEGQWRETSGLISIYDSNLRPRLVWVRPAMAKPRI